MIDRPLALSVERVRHEMLRGILIPRELVNEALLTTAKNLKARKPHFFAHKGKVIDYRETDDGGLQLQAADQIYSLAGLYSKNGEERVGLPQVAVEVDSQTGVMRLVVGGSASLPSPAESKVIENEARQLNPQQQTFDLTFGEPPDSQANEPTYEEAANRLIAKRSRRNAKSVPDEVWNVVSDETVE